MDCFLYDRDLRHEIVKLEYMWNKKIRVFSGNSVQFDTIEHIVVFFPAY